jgi:hypothetical protein
MPCAEVRCGLGGGALVTTGDKSTFGKRRAVMDVRPQGAIPANLAVTIAVTLTFSAKGRGSCIYRRTCPGRVACCCAWSSGWTLTRDCVQRIHQAALRRLTSGAEVLRLSKTPEHDECNHGQHNTIIHALGLGQCIPQGLVKLGCCKVVVLGLNVVCDWGSSVRVCATFTCINTRCCASCQTSACFGGGARL